MTTKQEFQQVAEISVAELFQKGQYTIPIYQRNYAWGEPEVEQLLQDVMDAATRDDEQCGSYYIGSLVAYQRTDNSFEIIDGQQRHTTLSILLSVLKNEFAVNLGGIQKINLGFDSREKSDRTLRMLFNGDNPSPELQEESGIRSAYEVARRYLQREKSNLNLFAHYLQNKVKILRVIVPEGTDLNHYFEIMNNRGEQLEKHEVLKARLMSQLSDDDERSAFATIWDACTVMDRYVQLGIKSDLRKTVFGSDWKTCPEEFGSLCSALTINSEEQKGTEAKSLASIINKPQFRSSQKENSKESPGTFSSVINFPNFLLHVLRVTTVKDIPLDDKRLLDTFTEHNPEPRKFVLDLLKCRMLSDRYVIKRENEEDWSLKRLKRYKREKVSLGYVNSFAEDADNQLLIMLLSMFHVSFPTQVYKHWLSGALFYLYQNTDSSLTLVGGGYIQFMEALSDRFLYGRFSSAEPLDYFELTFGNRTLSTSFNVEHLNQGTHVQNFIFNRLDYLLWKQLKNKEVFDGVNMDYISKRAKGFSFTFRTSVEHYYPQHPLSGIPITTSDILPKGIDSFGNLCLISHRNNSKLSNYLPTAKKEHYEKATAVESLKQVFMMSCDDWGPEHPEVIAEHEGKMVEVLCS
ncbi:DUF262 domain-containing protein [Neptunomonas qingdaonensis]|uniref:DUF262 domain-containing protein n=1 Tax=Neptunomonas qingdaonensis TaxID=1045558 RepID=A0A1I2TVR0_9GAMM|nr:DUF262 domain-containing protein [Neptunomonas qingdaonensis]SFG68299.1 Protein of unknown function [Neptunomonas qingdaonensis]